MQEKVIKFVARIVNAFKKKGPEPCPSCALLKTEIESMGKDLAGVVKENLEIWSLRQKILFLETDLIKQKREQTQADLLMVSAKIIKTILEDNEPPAELLNQQADLQQQLNSLSQIIYGLPNTARGVLGGLGLL